MEYDGARRCLPQHFAYPNYYYNNRNSAPTLAHATRENPRGYPMGGPVGGMHHRPNVGREEPLMETGPARKRIPVAVSQGFLSNNSPSVPQSDVVAVVVLPSCSIAALLTRLLVRTVS
jgi:hypothetical protein